MGGQMLTFTHISSWSRVIKGPMLLMGRTSEVLKQKELSVS